jgi:replication fork clamp-binding protein CrfC
MMTDREARAAALRATVEYLKNEDITETDVATVVDSFERYILKGVLFEGDLSADKG